ncbi:hypothetical protein KAU08_08195 [bacterium]|nr:hypothetical protein [bacterium]
MKKNKYLILGIFFSVLCVLLILIAISFSSGSKQSTSDPPSYGPLEPWIATVSAPDVNDFGDEGYSIAVYDDGSIYLCGYFGRNSSFNPPHSGINPLDAGMFLSKYSVDGVMEWIKFWNFGTSYTAWYYLTLDVAGNIYIAGNFYGEVDFSTNDREIIHTSNGGQDCFLMKLSNSGDWIWSRTWGGASDTSQFPDDYISGLISSPSGDIAVIGAVSTPTVFSDRNSTFDIIPTGMRTSYLIIFTTNSDIVGHHVFEVTMFNDLPDVTCSDQGNYFITGTFAGVMELDCPSGPDRISAPSESPICFVSRLDKRGKMDWLHQGYDFQFYDLVVDDSESVYVSGSYFNNASPDNGVFLRAFDPNGNIVWERPWGISRQHSLIKMDIDINNNLVLAGLYVEPSNTVTANRGYDIFLRTVTNDGLTTNTFTFGGPERDILNDLVVDNSNNIYLTGSFTDSIEFPPEFGIKPITFGNGQDCFAVRINLNESGQQ